MSQPLQGTIKPRRSTRLVATDLHWLWWLKLRSLNLLDQGLSEVPYLWPEGDGKRLRLYLEAVSEEQEMSVWASTNPIDHAATLMVLLAAAEDEFPDFDPERPPETPISPHLRWAIQRALEDHALRRIVCYPLRRRPFPAGPLRLRLVPELDRPPLQALQPFLAQGRRQNGDQIVVLPVVVPGCSLEGAVSQLQRIGPGGTSNPAEIGTVPGRPVAPSARSRTRSSAPSGAPALPGPRPAPERRSGPLRGRRP